MNKNTHEIAAKEHIKIAEDYDKKMEIEKDENRKTALMTVAAQNYFYAGINAIESVLARNQIHSLDHTFRLKNLMRNIGLFKDGDTLSLKYKIMIDEDISYRGKVAYRGENGKKFISIKEFAKTAIGELNE